ncbi:hypothetical protein [Noviherbaspirillum massiliense]|uniref:hypothetical protein n=1 Tax=Noviherbaspirillum massiliense TaxID=1465823 RepID=UPI0002D3CD96|nr:hypothetical protein [Noviherbaspirillum massiliense]
MAFHKWRIALVSFIIVLAGCAGPAVDPKDETLSLVYGYVDMTDAPSSLEWVSIKKYGGQAGWYNVPAKDGLFWHIGIEPGAYQVEKFGGRGGSFLTRRDHEYLFGTKGRNETAIRIQTPGVFFMGAYKYVDHAGGFWKQGQFEMKALKAPSEKELLQRLIKELEADDEMREYTRQINLAKKRLATLQ